MSSFTTEWNVHEGRQAGLQVSEVFSLAVVPGASCRYLDEVGCFKCVSV